MKVFQRFKMVAALLLVIATFIVAVQAKNQHQNEPTFTCLIVCMDGRYEPALVDDAKKSTRVDCVDVITEAGPVKRLAERPATEKDKFVLLNILDRVEISIRRHHAKEITIGAHQECAGDPVAKDLAINHLRASREWLHGELEKRGMKNIPIRLAWAEGGWKKPSISHLP